MEEAYAAYDPEKAKQLLDELGMVDADGDGWRDRLDGEPFLFIFEFFRVQAPLAGADFAKRYWEAIGIRVDVKETSGGAYGKVRNRYEKHGHDVACRRYDSSHRSMVPRWGRRQRVMESLVQHQW